LAHLKATNDNLGCMLIVGGSYKNKILVSYIDLIIHLQLIGDTAKFVRDL